MHENIRFVLKKKKERKKYVLLLCGCRKRLKLCLTGLIKRSLSKDLIFICVCFFNLFVFKHMTSLGIAVSCVWENKGKQC